MCVGIQLYSELNTLPMKVGDLAFKIFSGSKCETVKTDLKIVITNEKKLDTIMES